MLLLLLLWLLGRGEAKRISGESEGKGDGMSNV